eukprot:TRINITY_DN662_c0_g2_i5.p1 TRINITY_DN662_c0_g2~~TRINITY_DN662_c0_g2_i5.p1  ORF type:complete len:229 (-),score=92.86 TRINITY_DN662_c0_g2_i5:4-690(-)
MGQSGSKAGINIEVSEQQIVTSTGLTVEQVHEIHETIKTNFNQKNYLSKRRFYIIADHLSRYHPELANDDLKSIYFNLFDSDHNGKIDIQELIVGLAVFSTGNKELKIRLAFKAFDINNDGCLSRGEITRMIEKSSQSFQKVVRHSLIEEDTPFIVKKILGAAASLATTAAKMGLKNEIDTLPPNLTIDEFISILPTKQHLNAFFLPEDLLEFGKNALEEMERMNGVI